jgi:hypothetical protein
MTSLPKKTVFLICLTFVLLLLLFVLKVKNEMVDFEVNYEAAKRLRWGETLYRVADEHYQFKYMPFSSFLYLPLTLLPLPPAKTFWFFCIAAAMFLLVYLSNRIAGNDPPFWPIVFLPVLILGKFLLRELQLGQINSIVTVILLFMTMGLTHKKEAGPLRNAIWPGISWGLATALKPYAFIFLPYFVIKKKWLSLVTGFGFLLLAFLAPSLYYGMEGNIIVHQEWYSTLSKSTPNLLKTQDNVSLVAFFSKWTNNPALSLVLTGIALGLLSILVLFLIHRGKGLQRGTILECSILLICIPLVSPLGWDYTFLMSILGLTIILKYFSRYPLFWRYILVLNLCIISLSLYDLMGRKAYSVFMSWSILTINFIILLGYLSYLRLKKIA